MAERHIRESDWDSSKACLMRIDDLIKTLHRIRIKDPFLLSEYGQEGIHELYFDTLDALYIEAQTKMDQKELEKSEEFHTTFKEIYFRRKVDFDKRFIYKTRTSRYTNPAHTGAWGELKSKGREFEIFLMRTLDRHNMLLKDKSRPEDNIL